MGLLGHTNVALHAFEDGDDTVEEREHAPVDECSAVIVGRRVLSIVFGALLAERVLDCDGQAEGEAGELDHEVGAAVEVKVGELPEGALHLEQAQGFVVEHEDTCLACCEGGKGARRGA